MLKELARPLDRTLDYQLTCIVCVEKGPSLLSQRPVFEIGASPNTGRLANIFGNGTIYGHDKKLKRAETPELNQDLRLL